MGHGSTPRVGQPCATSGQISSFRCDKMKARFAEVKSRLDNEKILKSVPPFVVKLYHLMETLDGQCRIHWNQSGDGFVIIKTDDCGRNILGRWFKRGHFPSFIRQLNAYGFRRHFERDDVAHEFRHPYFQRGKLEWLPNIKRKKVSMKRAMLDALTKEVTVLRRENDKLEQFQDSMLLMMSKYYQGTGAITSRPRNGALLVNHAGSKVVSRRRRHSLISTTPVGSDSDIVDFEFENLNPGDAAGDTLKTNMGILYDMFSQSTSQEEFVGNAGDYWRQVNPNGPARKKSRTINTVDVDFDNPFSQEVLEGLPELGLGGVPVTAPTPPSQPSFPQMTPETAKALGNDLQSLLSQMPAERNEHDRDKDSMMEDDPSSDITTLSTSSSDDPGWFPYDFTPEKAEQDVIGAMEALVRSRSLAVPATT